MNILVLNGSPKGSYSITLQTILYLQRKFPREKFEVLHVGQKIKSLEKDFTPLTPETAGTVRKIELPIKPEEKEKEVTWKERAQAWIEAGNATPYAILAGAGLVLLGLGGWLFYWHRSCCRLIETEPDYRLASRYGAGVSRYVRYLEGKEVKKEKSPV